MTRRQQAIAKRIRDVYEDARSGNYELVGKAKRIATPAGESAAYQERGPRFRGGFEGGESPRAFVRAVDRGKGKVFVRIKRAAKEWVRQHYDAAELNRRGGTGYKRRAERPTIPPHRKLSGRCKKCGVPHGKNEHRFHGTGALLKTHLFPYKSNPKKRRKVVKRRNPPAVVIYGKLIRIEAKKGPGHRCDPGCVRADHSYFHDFSAGAVVYGLPDGSLVIRRSDGKRLWKYF